jgi:hypothetical protein
MKKLIGMVLVVTMIGICMNIGVNQLNAYDKKWVISVPGYNIGTTYSYYQPLLATFQENQIKWMGLDPIKDHSVVWSQGFIVRYSVTSNIQVGIHYNTQFDQWSKVTLNDTYSLHTTAALTSFLPTAVFVWRIPINKGYFSLGGGVGYYVVKYTDDQHQQGITGQDTPILATEVFAGNFGCQTFFEFSHPLFWDWLCLGIRAGYVSCVIPQPLTLRTQSSYTYIPDIDLSGLLATVGFTIEF